LEKTEDNGKKQQFLTYVAS